MITTSVKVDLGQAGDDGSRRTEQVNFLHNGDYSGDCTIVVRGYPDRQFTLPCDALLRFAAEIVRGAKMHKLEKADYLDLLDGGVE